MSTDWIVHDLVGEAGVFHETDPQPARSATFYGVVHRTLALGSAQRTSDVDERVAAALSVSVVKRRSGGGAVLLLPNEFVWLDLVIPENDALWVDDVGRSMIWVGELWQRALADLGVATDVRRDTDGGSARWSRQVCFAGLGAGEVVIGERKLVGVSQRRTRALARFQTLCHLQWRPEVVAALVAAPRPLATDLAVLTASVAASALAIRDALVRNLPD